MKRFAGWLVTATLGVFDFVMLLGMPWEPNLEKAADRWILALVAFAALCLSFAAGWYQRGQRESARAQGELQGFEVRLSRVKADYEGRREREAKTYAKRLADKDAKHEEEIAAYERAISDKDAALRRERERSAELAARWDGLQSEERRKREVFDKLNAREKWCIAKVVEIYPQKFSANKHSIYDPSLDVLSEDAGILRFHCEEELHGQQVRVYSLALEWRIWISDHADELPDPTWESPA